MDAIAPSRCDRASRGLPWAVLALLGFAGVARAAPLDTLLQDDGMAPGGSAQVATPADSPGGNIDDALFASPTTRDHIGRVVVPVKIGRAHV